LSNNLAENSMRGIALGRNHGQLRVMYSKHLRGTSQRPVHGAFTRIAARRRSA